MNASDRFLGILLAAGATLLAWPALARDYGDPRPGPGKPGAGAQPPCYASSIRPPVATDGDFVVDSGANLDGCTIYRGDGEVRIYIPVPRYLGSGPHSSTMTLSIMAYDVDDQAPVMPPFEPEVDEVLLNGARIGYLSGGNDAWAVNRFTVATDELNFPLTVPPTGAIAPALNEIVIRIDTANADVGEDVWSLALDWVALEGLEAWRPVILAHGCCFNGKPEIWDELWVPELDARGIDNLSVSLGPWSRIEHNSAILASTIHGVLARYGVSAVDIVAHSKGGVDSRYYIWTHPGTVRNLVMIGTPNRGSPFGEVTSFGGLGQLAPSSMTRFNGYVTDYYRTKYVTLAGDWDPGGLCNGSCLISGHDDGLVSVTSAHGAVGGPEYTLACPQPSVCGHTEPKHNNLIRSDRVFHLLYPELDISAPGTFPMVVAAGPMAWSRPPLPSPAGHDVRIEEDEEAPQLAARFEGVILADSTRSHSVLVDSGAYTTFSLDSPADSLTFTLVDPYGRTIDPGTPGEDPNVTFNAPTESWTGNIQSYDIANPVPGTWTLRLHGTNVFPPQGAPYVALALLQQPAITLAVAPDRTFYRHGQPLGLLATLREGALPVTAALVEAFCLRPDSSGVTLPLFDDGTHGDTTADDGEYFNRLDDTALCGFYLVAVTARDLPGVRFDRAGSLTTLVSCTESYFLPQQADHVVDTNGDGLSDILLVDCAVQTSAEGRYRVTADLLSADGTPVGVAASADTTLAPGIHAVPLRFDGSRIFGSGRDGPYRVTRLTLLEMGDELTLPADLVPEALPTAAYPYRTFQHPPLSPTVPLRDTPADTNGDGSYEQLRFELDLDVLRSDRYVWSAALVDSAGVSIDFYTGSDSLAAGPRTIEFRYDGARIGAHRIDGPFHVRDLLMYGALGDNLDLPDAGQSRAYSWRQFMPPACGQPALSLAGSRTISNVGGLWRFQLGLLNAGPDSAIAIEATLQVPGGGATPIDGNCLYEGIAVDSTDWGGADSFALDISRFHEPLLAVLLETHCHDRCHTAYSQALDLQLPVDLLEVPPGGGGASLSLARNVPNPFTGQTRIGFHLPRDGSVTLEVYDVTGRLVRTLVREFRKAGDYSETWNGRDADGHRLGSGLYLYRLNQAGGIRTGRMILY